MSLNHEQRLELLGTVVDPMTIPELHEVIAGAVEGRSRTVIASVNLHGAAVALRETAVRDLHRKHLVRIDGMPIVLWARILGYEVQRTHRVTWVDWLPLLLEEAQIRDWSIAYLGSRPDALALGLRWIARRAPNVRFVGHHGHFDATPGAIENDEVVCWVNETHADILLVGMGMPRQEKWVHDNVGGIRVPVILTCGAAIDYYAGAVPTPPRWMGRVGLEWLARMVAEPSRLWRRYLMEPWVLLPVMWSDIRKALQLGRGRRD